MTPEQLIAFGEERHGEMWIPPLAKETGYSFSHLWRIANENRPVSDKLARTLDLLRRKPVKTLRKKQQPKGQW